ncbi:M24 family metallopeptidase [[Clostridium] innocuum]|nr:M24 family metallopeptidase [Erysipelotrichaceae bacterium]MCR0383469.1 M24 family metallopeptidase [[Clostridium] innocuum]MCR0415400.1 M24 family metallopeptidase [[Clostridium] innocuum]MCR0536506.1 M24 family metallopeptidase [[Clostridium] innocuum]MCR0540571.1 M24 family metallopeptidase [[Clostridium] innocuum]
MIKLKEVEAPMLEEGLIPVMLSDETMQNRKARLLEKMQRDGFDAVVVYADLEHGSNFEYLCGFLPRFEEALLVLHADGKAFMVLGNENLNKAEKARIEAVPIHMPHFSLPNQPMQTEKSVAQILASCELEKAEKIGLIGWKNFTSQVEDNHLLFDLPYFLVEALKTVCQKAQFTNAAYLLIGENGVRTTNNANEFAHYEYGAALAGNCILKTMDRLEVGKTEMEMAETLAADGQRHSVVTIMATGARFEKANLYPGNKQIQCGDKISITTGFKGGLQSRAGYAVECAEQLPEKEQEYLTAVAIPYFQAVKVWLETIKIGINGNDLYEAIEAVLPKKAYGWTLNPGHLCADEEWMSSPIYPQSKEALQSGMLFQIDIIPSVNGYGGVSCESGILLADEELRKEIARKYPAVWERIVKRRAYMQEVLGIHIHEDVLPTSMATAYLRPYLLKKEMALVNV